MVKGVQEVGNNVGKYGKPAKNLTGDLLLYTGSLNVHLW